MRQVNGKEEKPRGQHPKSEDWQEPEQPADGQENCQRKPDGKPTVAAQPVKRPPQGRGKAFQCVKLPVKSALAP
jgi:hypothetical protein